MDTLPWELSVCAKLFEKLESKRKKTIALYVENNVMHFGMKRKLTLELIA
jgi:hypothetical protein